MASAGASSAAQILNGTASSSSPVDDDGEVERHRARRESRRREREELREDPARPAYFLQTGAEQARSVESASEASSDQFVGEELVEMDGTRFRRADARFESSTEEETEQSEEDATTTESGDDDDDEEDEEEGGTEDDDDEGESFEEDGGSSQEEAPRNTRGRHTIVVSTAPRPSRLRTSQRTPLTPEQHRALQDAYVVLESAPSLRGTESSHRIKAYPANKPTPAPALGRMHVFVLRLELPTIRDLPSTPYVRLRLADQTYDTCVSSRPEGGWNEGFEFRIPLHLQIFGTLECDVYQGNAIAPDQWIGRCSIRLADLEGLPETYETWHELWGRMASSPSTGQARGEVPLLAFGPPSGIAGAGMAAKIAEARGLGRIGALRLRVVYSFQPIAVPRPAPRQLEEQSSRRRSVSRGRSPKPRETIPQDLIPASPTTPSSATPRDASSSQPTSPTLRNPPGKRPLYPPQQQPKSEEDLFFGPDLFYDESSDSPPASSPDLLERLTETFAGGRDNLRLFQAIRALLASVGQGIEEYLGSPTLLSGLLLLRRYHGQLTPPEPRKERIVRTLSVIEELKWSYRYAMAAYGWVGVGFQAGASGASIRAPSATHQGLLLTKNPDAASIVSFLRIPREDLVESEIRSAGVFAPFHYICADRMREEMVLAIRGSLSARDVLTDLASFYTRWNGGLAHHGMLRSAGYFYNRIVPIAVDEMRKRGYRKLRLVGHSLGAATSTLLCIMLVDTMDRVFLSSEWPEGVEIYCDAFGTPQTASPEICSRPEYVSRIRNVVCGWDVFSRASYGSVEDLKCMVVAAVEACGGTGHLREVWKFLASDTGAGEDQAAFAALEETRASLGLGVRGARARNPKLWPPGTIYFLHKPPGEDTRDARAGDGIDRRQAGSWVMERVDGSELEEIALRPSMLVDHFPST